MFSEFRNAFGRSNHAHVQLIVINVIVFLVLAVLMVLSTVAGYPEIFKSVNRQFVLSPIPAELLTHPWTLFTYAFNHSLSDIWHIVFNMLTLYWFGRLFVEYLGSDKLIAVYVLGALAGAGTYLGLTNLIPFFAERAGTYMVGASGAIYAVMVACATLLPDYTFFLLFFGPVRIKYIAFFFIVISFIGTVSANAGGNLAHLGGALIGYVYIRQMQAGINWGGWVTRVLDFFRGLSKPKVRVTHRRSGPAAAASGAAKGDDVSQAEIDAILDKISEGGYQSLTREEKEKLFRAGKR